MDAIAIRRWIECPDPKALIPEIDAIFFTSSATQAFESETARSSFRERWLGRYLAGNPDLTHIAIAPGGTVAGYIIGSLEDPALSSRFSDLGYFQKLAALTREFPAQLHINLAPQYRSHGIGARLIEALASDVAAAGAPGLHAITARGMRNVGFYLRNGFAEVGSVDWNGRDLVFLARKLRS